MLNINRTLTKEAIDGIQINTIPQRTDSLQSIRSTPSKSDSKSTTRSTSRPKPQFHYSGSSSKISPTKTPTRLSNGVSFSGSPLPSLEEFRSRQLPSLVDVQMKRQQTSSYQPILSSIHPSITISDDSMEGKDDTRHGIETDSELSGLDSISDSLSVGLFLPIIKSF
jgi:hypothetical protein